MPIFAEQSDMFTEESIEDLRAGETSNFTGNMKIPIHRWFRFSAGYSGEWVYKLLRMKSKNNPDLEVLDPFLGCGTTSISADFAGVKSYGTEAHPFLYRIAKAKSYWTAQSEKLHDFSQDILDGASDISDIEVTDVPDLLQKCYSEEILEKLFKIRKSWRNLNSQDEISELAWLAITSTLRECSKAGTAPWQYVLPNQESKNVKDPFQALEGQVKMMVKDMKKIQKETEGSKSEIYSGDARKLDEIPDDQIDLVITSPPYTNNYDYADSTRLEMTFWGEVERWADLHETARKYLVRSCTQHVTKEKNNLQERLKADELEPIIDELKPVCEQLNEEKQNHGGKKKYDQMVAAYFKDQFLIWKELRRVCKNQSEICFVLGDSAPYGVHVPVEKWISEIAKYHGFQKTEFSKIRDRNVKWDNRTHEVPLKEGNLWVYSR